MIRLAIASRRQYIEVVQEALDALLLRLDMDPAVRWRLSLAAREAVVNAIVHGNRDDPDKTVWITAEERDGELVVTIEDEGAGFDLARLPDPRAPERRLAPGGRGVLLIRELVDDARFAPRDGGGFAVTLRTRLLAPADPAP